MKLSVLIIASLSALILAATACGQEQGLSFNFFGGGARSEGMGQAFLGVSDDGTAGSWNPAGLNIHEKTLMVFSYSFLRPRGSYTFHINDTTLNTYNHSGSFGALNYWNIVSPLRVKGHHVVLNLSYARNFDIYYRFEENLFDDWTGEEPNASFEKHGGINSINLALGTRLYKQLSFGLSGNVYFGKVVSEENRYFQRYLDDPYVGLVNFESNVQVIDSTTFSGFNTTVGLMYASEGLRAGLVLRTPFNLKGESDTTHYLHSTANGVSIEQIPYYIPGYGLFVSDTVYIDNITSKMQMPMMVGFGLGYNATDNWLLAGDVEFKKFSGRKVRNLKSIVLTAGGESIETFTDRDPNWSDVWQFRLGTEYLLNTSIGEIPLRAGFRNEAFPGGNVSSYDIVYEGPRGSVANDSTRIFYIFEYDAEKITGYSVSIGSGIHWSQILLDFAYTYTTYDQGISTGTDVLRSENEWKNHHLNFTFSGYF